MNISQVKEKTFLGTFIINDNFANMGHKDEGIYGTLINFKLNSHKKSLFKGDKISLKDEISCIYLITKDKEIIKIGQTGDSAFIKHYEVRGFTGKPNKSRFNSHLQIYSMLKKDDKSSINIYAIFQKSEDYKIKTLLGETQKKLFSDRKKIEKECLKEFAKVNNKKKPIWNYQDAGKSHRGDEMEKLKQLWDSNKMKQQKIENSLLEDLRVKNKKITMRETQILLTLFYHGQICLYPKNERIVDKVKEFITEKKAFWERARNYRS